MDAGGYRLYVLTGSVQSGKTWIGFVIPCLYHLFEVGENVIIGCPKIELAQSIFEERLLPAIEASRYAGLLPTSGQGSRGGRVKDTILFGNGARLRFLGANSGEIGISSHTARVVVLTEIDKMDTVRSGSGHRGTDPIRHMLARSKSFGDRALAYAECTVSTKDGRTWKEVQEWGTATEVQIPCRHCGAYAMPAREQLEGWQEAPDEITAGELTRYRCAYCRGLWDAEDRAWSLERPLLVSAGQRVENGVVVGERRKTRTWGLRWNCMEVSLLSLAGIGSEEWLAARADNDAAEKERLQFGWALPWEEGHVDLSQITAESVARKVNGLGHGVAPNGTQVVVGVDLGLHRCWWMAVAWRPDYEGSIIDYGEIVVPQGAKTSPLAILGALRMWRDTELATGWRTPDGQTVKARLVLVDVRFEGQIARAFCRESGVAMATIGVAGIKDPRGWKWNKAEQAMALDGARWKGAVHSGLAGPLGAPASISLWKAKPATHRTVGKHLAAETLSRIWSPGRGWEEKWVQHYKHNHLLDCLALSRAGVEILAKEGRWTPSHAPILPSEPVGIRTRY